jgi:hypothetical protein
MCGAANEAIGAWCVELWPAFLKEYAKRAEQDCYMHNCCLLRPAVL